MFTGCKKMATNIYGTSLYQHKLHSELFISSFGLLQFPTLKTIFDVKLFGLFPFSNIERLNELTLCLVLQQVKENAS
jgi:hypothetical protein